MSKFDLKIRPFGTHAVLMEWPAQVEEAILEDIIGYISVLNTKIDLSHWELVPAYNSLTLINHKTAVDFDRFQSDLLAWYAQGYSVAKTKRYLWRLPVCYDLDFGIDMEEVSQNLGLEAKDIIDLHTSQKYTVYGIGFLPRLYVFGRIAQETRNQAQGISSIKSSEGLCGTSCIADRYLSARVPWWLEYYRKLPCSYV